MSALESKSESGRSLRKNLRSAITPEPLLALVYVSILLLVVAIFVFGERGKYSDPDVADIIRTVALGALAAAVATLVDRQVVLRDLYANIESSTRSAVELSRSIDELGIHAAFPKFDYGLIFREARRGETVSWLDTYCPRQNEFYEDIERCVERGVAIRMLIIDAGCENAKHRNEELETTVNTGGGWDAGLAGFMAKMQTVASKATGLFEIRYYSDLPCVPMYLIGNGRRPRKGYFSLFLVRPSAGCHHIELRSGEWLADMAKYFEAKWNRQTPVVREEQ